MTDLSEGADPRSVTTAADNVVPLNVAARQSRPQEIVAFNRRELDQILRLYGNKVASGEWRDYAIDMLRERAVFSIFKRAAEVP
jgi:hypothetical protein